MPGCPHRMAGSGPGARTAAGSALAGRQRTSGACLLWGGRLTLLQQMPTFQVGAAWQEAQGAKPQTNSYKVDMLLELTPLTCMRPIEAVASCCCCCCCCCRCWWCRPQEHLNCLKVSHRRLLLGENQVTTSLGMALRHVKASADSAQLGLQWSLNKHAAMTYFHKQSQDLRQACRGALGKN